MTLAWMIFGTVVSLVVVCGAGVATSAARLLEKPTRGIWIAALAAIFLLVVSAPFREQSAVMSLVGLPRALPSANGTSSAQASVGIATRIAAEASASLRAVLHSAVSSAPASMDRYLALAWPLASALLLMLLVVVYWRIRVARRVWPVAELQGAMVRVSENSGPAVVGLRAPEIVVPRWVLTRDAEQQRMVLAHEQEHVRAGDHLTLAAGCVAAALMPWNPAVWWALSRLRLAIELDCDARVLRRGAEPQSYGSLLIDLAEHSSGFPMGAPALVDGTSHLQTRVMAMQTHTYRFARTRGSLVGLAAAALFLVACEAKLPTSAEIQQMDVASAEKAMTMGQTGNVHYQIDGVNATSEQAHALRPEQIVGIEVSQRANGESGNYIYIRTVNGAQRVAYRPDSAGAAAEREKVQGFARTAMSGDSVILSPAISEFKGLLIVDGAIVDASTFKKLNPKDIHSVEVLKGPAAMAKYNDPRAANGVITITLKKGSE